MVRVRESRAGRAGGSERARSERARAFAAAVVARAARRSRASRLLAATWMAKRRCPARLESSPLPAMRSATMETARWMASRSRRSGISKPSIF
jgi:hypothetical protein